MSTSTKQRNVRVTEATHEMLRTLSSSSEDSMSAIIERAVDLYRREQILRQANAAWAKLMEDPEAKAELDAEDALWDATVGDGLEDDPW